MQMVLEKGMQNDYTRPKETLKSFLILLRAEGAGKG